MHCLISDEHGLREYPESGDVAFVELGGRAYWARLKHGANVRDDGLCPDCGHLILPGTLHATNCPRG